jgi:hypothetical protein
MVNGTCNITEMIIGLSDEAKYVNKTKDDSDSLQHLQGSAFFGNQQVVFHTLENVFEECKTPNWDGNGALPVLETTHKKASYFIEALQPKYSLPSSVVAEPDGHLNLEWYCNPQWTISVSISPEGILYYAALFDDESTSGSEIFSEETRKISDRLLGLLEKVDSAQNRQ